MGNVYLSLLSFQCSQLCSDCHFPFLQHGEIRRMASDIWSMKEKIRRSTDIESDRQSLYEASSRMSSLKRDMRKLDKEFGATLEEKFLIERGLGLTRLGKKGSNLYQIDLEKIKEEEKSKNKQVRLFVIKS